MKKLIYTLVFVSLTIAVVFWATSEVDPSLWPILNYPYGLGT